MGLYLKRKNEMKNENEKRRKKHENMTKKMLSFQLQREEETAFLSA